MRASKYGLCLAALLAVSACASAPHDAPAGTEWGRFATWQPTDPAYRFYPGDQIDITVHTAPELSRTVAIGPDGRVALPLLPNLMVADRTDNEIAAVIAEAYARDILIDPIVEVRRGELGPQNIIVGGQVNAPGLVEISGPVGTLEAVMLAGGFRDSAARGEVAVLRREPGGTLMMRTVNLHDALSGRPGSDAVQIRRHDIIFVPRSTVAEINVFVEQYVTGIIPLDQAFSYAIADVITGN